MKVAIFGATGATGRLVVEQALAEGHTVTAFARNPEAVTIKHVGLSIVQGNVFQATDVRRGVEGQDAVICTIGGHDAFRRLKQASQRGLCTTGTRHMLAAMEQCHVARFICMSSWGVGGSRERVPFRFARIIFPLMMKEEFLDKEEQEQLISQSKLDWTIVRPSVLTNTPPTGTYRVEEKLKFSARSHISRADVADFLVKQLTDTTFLRRSVEISS